MKLTTDMSLAASTGCASKVVLLLQSGMCHINAVDSVSSMHICFSDDDSKESLPEIEKRCLV